jgi:serpin B
MNATEIARTAFANRLYAKLACNQTGQNLFLSPFSIRVALAMCAAGARCLTRRVLADLIGEPESVDEQNQRYARLLASISGDGNSFQLITANALWGQEGSHFHANYQKQVADFYDGTFREFNFRARPDETAETINAWVSEKTREKIKELVNPDSLTSDTRLILTNAIYFKAEWENVFSKRRTSDEDWHAPHVTRQVPMMQRSGGYHYYEDDGFQALELPYRGGRVGMLVVLPKNPDGLTALESRWGTEGLYQRVTAGLQHEKRVIISLPRFKIETVFNLKPALCDLGAALAFSNDADFRGIGDEPLKLSAVVHKAFVEVNEDGTEAAAATEVRMALMGIRFDPEPKVFRADHPFLFFIRDKQTDMVYFSGRVLDPN